MDLKKEVAEAYLKGWQEGYDHAELKKRKEEFELNKIGRPRIPKRKTDVEI